MALLLLPSSYIWASPYPKQYDDEIRKAAKIYLPGVDWRLLKAQYYQESRLDPSAVSPVGAAGIAQFMPGTWRDVSRSLGYEEQVNPHIAEPAIHAGAYYMAKLRKSWSSPRPEADRYNLALASYNAGLGNLLKAQRACNGAVLYPAIEACLPSITGHHANETKTYVRRIRRYYSEMLFL